MTTPRLRKRLKQYHRYCDHVLGYAIRTGIELEQPKLPDECIGMVCNATTRGGGSCQESTLFRNGRCRLHGGLSTGPKTLEGKRRSALNTGKTYEELLKNKKC